MPILWFILGALFASFIWGLWIKSHGFFKKEFTLMAQDIFDDKSRHLRESHTHELSHLLNPLKDQIKQFEQKIQESHEKESRDRMSLFHEIKHLKDLNQKMSSEAIALTQALKGDSKKQGNWGEMVLERVLEMSGLQKGREYDVQISIQDESGKRFQPDVIIHLPEQRDVIVDSKVSLVAYEKLQHTDDPAEYALHLQAHLQSLRTHVRQLSDKQYQKLQGIRTLDFVLMFIPIEPALHLAMQTDESIFSEALSRNVVLVTPTTLLATLRTIHNIWRFEYQNENAIKIADKAGSLYDKFVGFIEDIQEIGKRIESTQKSYESAMNKLKDGKGNLIRRAEEMKNLGVATSKKMPEAMKISDEES
ncbi:MAG: DNA recombination protein RmuC [Gammaproteobacteria bacterium]